MAYLNGVYINKTNTNEVIVRKDKKRLIQNSIFFVLFIVLNISFYLYVYRNGKFNLNDQPLIIFLITFFSFCLLVIIVSNIVRAIKHSLTYVIVFADNIIYINNKVFCKKMELNNIVIQASAGWEGIGESYIIGLSCNKSFFPLSFYHSLDEAKNIADLLSSSIGFGIKFNKNKAISIFKGY